MNIVLSKQPCGLKFGKGVIGLSPQIGDESFVRNLHKNGWLPEAIVGLNYENPLDSD